MTAAAYASALRTLTTQSTPLWASELVCSFQTMNPVRAATIAAQFPTDPSLSPDETLKRLRFLSKEQKTPFEIREALSRITEFERSDMKYLVCLKTLATERAAAILKKQTGGET